MFPYIPIGFPVFSTGFSHSLGPEVPVMRAAERPKVPGSPVTQRLPLDLIRRSGGCHQSSHREPVVNGDGRW